MIIRKVTPQDMKAVLGLIIELAVFEKEPNAVIISEDDLIRDGFSEQPLFSTFVAEIESTSKDNKLTKEIIGVALYYNRYSTWKGKTIHLEDLVVKESHRGTGAGFALYSKIIKQGHKQGVNRIEWNVLDWNEGAIAFYEKSGAHILKDWYVVQMDASGIQNFVQKNK
jgi:GNAT superfamily N-acetyltransferase